MLQAVLSPHFMITTNEYVQSSALFVETHHPCVTVNRFNLYSSNHRQGVKESWKNKQKLRTVQEGYLKVTRDEYLSFAAGSAISFCTIMTRKHLSQQLFSRWCSTCSKNTSHWCPNGLSWAPRVHTCLRKTSRTG